MLCENLITLKAQAEVVRDRDYILKHNPESVAVLYGVIADKTLRMLEAAAAAQPLPGQESK